MANNQVNGMANNQAIMLYTSKLERLINCLPCTAEQSLEAFGGFETLSLKPKLKWQHRSERISQQE